MGKKGRAERPWPPYPLFDGPVSASERLAIRERAQAMGLQNDWDAATFIFWMLRLEEELRRRAREKEAV